MTPVVFYVDWWRVLEQSDIDGSACAVHSCLDHGEGYNMPPAMQTDML